MIIKNISNTSSYSKEQKDFLKEYYREYYLINFSRVFLLLFLLGLWQISSSLGWVDSFFFSSPLKIINLFFFNFILSY